jgi:hypothetical protein
LEESLNKKLEKFRFRKAKNNAAIVSKYLSSVHYSCTNVDMYANIHSKHSSIGSFVVSVLFSVKVDKNSQQIVLEEEYEVCWLSYEYLYYISFGCVGCFFG